MIMSNRTHWRLAVFILVWWLVVPCCPASEVTPGKQAAFPSEFFDLEIAPGYRDTLARRPFLMKTGGARILVLGPGTNLLVCVGWTDLRPGDANESTRRLEVARSNATTELARLNAPVEIVDESTSTVDFRTETGKSEIGLDSFFKITKKKFKTAIPGLPVIGTWTIPSEGKYCVAVGGLVSDSLDLILPVHPATRVSKNDLNDDNAHQVEVEGFGPDVEAARKAAIAQAVAAVVGELVDKETLVENQELVQNQILTYSNGYVEKMEVLSTRKNRDGLVAIRIRADVRRSALRQKITEVIATSADADGTSLFAEMLSRQNSIEDAEKMFAKVFAGHREDRLLEAGVVLRADGKPDVELDPNSGNVTITVRLDLNRNAWNDWASDAQSRFVKMCEKSELAKFRGSNSDIVIDDTRFSFKKDYEPIIQKQLKTVPERQWVRIALLDQDGCTIAASYRKTSDFRTSGSSPLNYYLLGYPTFTFRGPATHRVVIKGLSLADLNEISKIVCSIGDLRALKSSDYAAMEAYRKTHPEKTIRIGSESFKLVPLSPRIMVGTTEVTRALWEVVMGLSPTDKNSKCLPVVYISGNDCQVFLKRLNSIPEIRKSGLSFRLPRQEEWEAACRAGSTGEYCRIANGMEISKESLGDVAWYADNSAGKVHVVCSKKPNAFGLHDMLGNVRELVQPSLDKGDYIACGGSWDSYDKCCTSSSLHPPDYYSEYYSDRTGFRLFASEHFAGKSGVDALPPELARIKVVVTDGIPPVFQNDWPHPSEALDRENGRNEMEGGIKDALQDLKNRPLHRPKKKEPEKRETDRGKRKAIDWIALGVLTYFLFRSTSKKRD